MCRQTFLIHNATTADVASDDCRLCAKKQTENCKEKHQQGAKLSAAAKPQHQLSLKACCVRRRSNSCCMSAVALDSCSKEPWPSTARHSQSAWQVVIAPATAPNFLSTGLHPTMAVLLSCAHSCATAQPCPLTCMPTRFSHIGCGTVHTPHTSLNAHACPEAYMPAHSCINPMLNLTDPIVMGAVMSRQPAVKETPEVLNPHKHRTLRTHSFVDDRCQQLSVIC